MLRGFKNSEYLRYSINSKIDKEFNQYRQDNSVKLAQILSSVFSSAITTILISTLNQIITIENAFGKFFTILGIAIVIISITYGLLYFFISLIYNIIREKRVLKYGKNDIHELIEQFDNLACDSILLVDMYIEELNKKSASKEKYDYLVYEAIHYLRKAVNITEGVWGRKTECISESSDTTKIDHFRIKNLVSFMRVQIDFLIKQANITDISAKNATNKIEIDITELEKQIYNM